MDPMEALGKVFLTFLNIFLHNFVFFSEGIRMGALEEDSVAFLAVMEVVSAILTAGDYISQLNDVAIRNSNLLFFFF